MCRLLLFTKESTGAKQQTFAPGPPQGFHPLMVEMQEAIKERWLNQQNGSEHRVSSEAPSPSSLQQPADPYWK